MAPHLPEQASKGDLRDLGAKVRDLGLEIESIGASGNLLEGRSALRFARLMGAAAELGAPCITTGPSGKPNDDESFKQVVGVFGELTHVARNTGVKVSIKPHVNQAAYGTESALRLMGEVDTDWIGLNVDASHLWRTPELETPEESIPKLLPYLLTARIRDTLGRETPIGPVETQIPGGGAMNLSAIVDAFKQKEDLLFLTLEIVGTHTSADIEVPTAVAKTCFERLSPLVGK
jgi:sugar phosphate isomerase/epimerase